MTNLHSVQREENYAEEIVDVCVAVIVWKGSNENEGLFLVYTCRSS